MRRLFTILLMAVTVIIFGQSLSASKLLQYANSQNILVISKELKQLGFQTKIDNSEGYPIYQFAKKTSRGLEKIEMGNNSELFMFIYKSETAVYEILKSKVLTSDFKYSYSYKNAKYYESKKMRIGADDKNGIISIFKPLK